MVTSATAMGPAKNAVAAAIGYWSFMTRALSCAKVEAVTAAAQSRAISVLTDEDSMAVYT
jgi:hypothetical protein